MKTLYMYVCYSYLLRLIKIATTTTTVATTVTIIIKPITSPGTLNGKSIKSSAVITMPVQQFGGWGGGGGGN